MKKLVANAHEAVAGVLRDGMTILAGGFGLCGIPENLIAAIRDAGVKDLTLVSNNAGVNDFGLGILLSNGQVKKMISSYVGENKVFEKMFLEGTLEVELTPQGTLAERIRAAGAGLGGFYTPTGVGTMVAEGKETRVINGREYVLEMPLHADLAIVKAWKGDPWGNLVYRKTARNFNPVMATAAKVVLVEVEELVGLGDLDPDQVHTPGVYVNRMFQGVNYEKRIEKRTTRQADQKVGV
jgi:3-oxoacid CoA-transferase subunit A